MGLLPMLLWAVLVANALHFARRGNFGLSDLMITGLFGLFAYIASMILGSIGMAAASRELRSHPEQRPPLTVVLMFLTGAVLVLPWVAFVARLVGIF
jgi:hypothetical protein